MEKSNERILAVRRNRKRQKGMKYLLLALPFLIFVFAFCYVPLFGWIYALFDYKMWQRFSDARFVGLANFAKLLNDRDILRVLRNTMVMSLLNILCSPLPALFAIMLNDIRSRKIKKFVQTTTTLPNFLSWIVVFGLAFSLFSSQGVVNGFLKQMNLPVSEFGLLGDGNNVWRFQLGLSIWKSLGWNTIIYMAAITGIDTELYDAAKVDGAGSLQLVRYITAPGLIPTYLVLLLLSVGNLLNNGFDQYYMFWNSMVSDKIEVLDYYIYKLGFQSNQYSYSIVIGMLKSLVSVALLFTANKISRRLRGNPLI